MGRVGEKKAIYTCKHSHIEQGKWWEGSAVKWFGINPDLLRLGRILEAIIQGNKEKTMGGTKRESDVCLALILWVGFLSMLRSAHNVKQSMKDEGEGKASELEGVEVCLCRGHVHSPALPRHGPLLVEVPLSLLKCILFSPGCTSSPVALIPQTSETTMVKLIIHRSELWAIFHQWNNL